MKEVLFRGWDLRIRVVYVNIWRQGVGLRRRSGFPFPQSQMLEDFLDDFFVLYHADYLIGEEPKIRGLLK